MKITRNIIKKDIPLPNIIEIEIFNKKNIFKEEIEKKFLNKIIKEASLLNIKNICFYYNDNDYYNKKYSEYIQFIKDENLNYKNQNNIIKLPCHDLFNIIKISYDGFIVSCFMHRYKIANLRDYSILDAWNHPKLLNLRKQHVYKKITNECCLKCLEMSVI